MLDLRFRPKTIPTAFPTRCSWANPGCSRAIMLIFRPTAADSSRVNFFRPLAMTTLRCYATSPIGRTLYNVGGTVQTWFPNNSRTSASITRLSHNRRPYPLASVNRTRALAYWTFMRCGHFTPNERRLKGLGRERTRPKPFKTARGDTRIVPRSREKSRIFGNFLLFLAILTNFP